MKTIYKVLIATIIAGAVMNTVMPRTPLQTPAEIAAIEKHNAEVRLKEAKRMKEVAMDQLGVKCIKADKGGAAIGDTEARIRKCGWGKPQRINRTTTAHGVREQWVYGGGNYLYLKDGVVTAVQN